MAAALVTSPKFAEFSVVLTPLYCTVLNTLFAVTRASKELDPPSCTVRDSEAATATVPGPSIEPGEAVPYWPAAGAVNAL